jgi:hypothetical protein
LEEIWKAGWEPQYMAIFLKVKAREPFSYYRYIKDTFSPVSLMAFSFGRLGAIS